MTTRIESLGAHQNGQKHERPLRIAIVGAGLVGAVGALALSRLKNVAITVFERSPGPREAGAWISITVSTLLVLNKLIDPSEINEIVYRPPNMSYNIRHWRTGEIIVQNQSRPCYKDDYSAARTQRIPLLNMLLSHIPRGVVQYGRKVTNVENLGEEIKLIFEDRSSQSFDLVVAADGIYSKVRQNYFPDHRVSYKGAVSYRKCLPVSLVEHIPGLLDDSSAWRKDGEVVFLSRLGLGTYGIVIIKQEPPEVASTLQWKRAVGTEKLCSLREHYADWDPLIVKVLSLIDDIDAYPLDSGSWLQSLTRDDRVAFVGDAAHPTAGAYGAGAAMGYGDCWALYRSLETTYQGWNKNGGYDLQRALRIFNETRRYFLHRVETQMSIDIQNAKYVKGAGNDEREWIRRFKERNPPNLWLTDHDVELEFQKILAAEWTKSQI